MTMLRSHATTAAAVMLAAALGCGGGSGDAGTSAARALLEAIPEHAEEPAAQAATTYVGRVEGTDALIAVVADGGAAAAYVCDGAALSEWFLGASEGAALHLEGDEGGTIDARLAAAAVSGSLAVDGGEHAFSAMPAVERESGIYRTVEDEDGETIVSGWIFFDGEWRGADEDSGKGVVGAVSAGGIDDATGTGTGLPPASPPVPQEFDCGGSWCQHESLRCFISFMSEEKANLKGKKLVQANAMIKHAQKQLNDVGNDLANNNCASNGSECAGTGYNSALDTPNCG